MIVNILVNVSKDVKYESVLTLFVLYNVGSPIQHLKALVTLAKAVIEVYHGVKIAISIYSTVIIP